MTNQNEKARLKRVTPLLILLVLGFVVGASIAAAGVVGVDGDLEVSGSVRIQDGTEGAGRLFTSDSVGSGSWQPNPALLKLPISHYRFEQNVLDSEGGNHGVVTGAGTYAPGRKAFAFDLDGSTYLSLANESDFDFERTDPFTISAWVRPALGVQDGARLVAKTNDGVVGADPGYALSYDSGGIQGTNDRVIFGMRDSSLNLFFVNSSLGSITMDEWNHVVVTYSGNSNQDGLNIYINGVLNSSGTPSPITLSILNARALTIGAESDGGRAFDGMMDDVRVFDIELTASQIGALAGI